MKKIITIGRGDDADICVDDELVSRRHATIRILPLGKMEIRDFSKNGTYVNGIRLAVNKPYPVTRKDVVSFARVRQLDWDDVPDPMKPYRIGAIAFIVVIVVIVAFSLLSRIDWGGSDNRDMIEQYDEPKPIEKKDTEDKEEAKPKEKDGDKANPVPELFPKKQKVKSGDNAGKKGQDQKKSGDDSKKSKDSKGEKGSDGKDKSDKKDEGTTQWF